LQTLKRPFENQWFVIALSEEIKPGKKKATKLFGQDIVIWRKQDNSLAAIDARCPHMGASLAVGRVVDDAVECPYHGFLYDSAGTCIKTPLRSEEALIPRTLCNRSYAVADKAGWVFLFWGETADATKEIPFFDEVNEPLVHTHTIKEWPVSFSRFIENTVDVAHLGTVHRGTLSWTVPKVINVASEVTGNIIAMKPPSTTELPISCKIAYPNLALLHLHPKFLTVFAAVPIDEYNTRVYVRSSQGFVRVPLLGWLVTKLKHWADMAALWQDKQALFSVRPIRAEDARHEVLMDFEPHIVAYRKMRKRLLTEAGITSETDASH
jgi:phenylpropionate dioxygenase-like ring-hydroxylating dioxygenase large terminal subunit